LHLNQVQLERDHVGFGGRAKSALTGFLAVLLLLAVVFSVSPALHQTLHAGNNANSHFCLACSLAHGQVSATEVALVSGVVVPGLLLGGLLPDVSPVLAVDYRLSPSRAPPALASALSVVA
jgi:hypothetical protein